MHTLPAAKVVGHDFLGNHIGELLFRQPASRPTPSSNGSTICPSDSKTLRRGSTTLQPSKAKHATDTRPASPTLDVTSSFGGSADPVASLDQSSESSPSEPSSVDSRSGSTDADLHLHLDQLSISRKRVASEGGPLSPKISFVTNFGARPRRSGSRRAPSEAGSSNYFGLSSTLSSASMSPMEPVGGSINWNVPFREQHQSFANAIEQNAGLNRKHSQQSQSPDVASSQSLAPSATQTNQAAEIATPTASAESAVASTKSKSFSGSSEPVRQRLIRAATESTLDPIAQKQVQETPASPSDQSETTSSGLAHSRSMGAATSDVRSHRRMPSLVPKGDDERTFCFVNDVSSESETEHVLAESPEAADETTLPPVPEHSVPQTISKPMSQSSSQSSYKDVVEGQYGAHRGGSPAAAGVVDRHSPRATTPSDIFRTIARPTSKLSAKEDANVISTKALSAHTVVRGPDTQQGPVHVPLKVVSPVRPSGSSRPVRRLKIQPNVQSRPSLLERTMEQQRKASHAAIASNSNGAVSENAVLAATTPDIGEKPAQTPGSSTAIGDRYDPVACDAGQRTFRLQNAPERTNGDALPFSVIASDERAKRIEPTSQARTSDWARAQNLLASSQPDNVSLSTIDASGMPVEQHRPGAQSLLRHHTTSYSSESTDSPSLLDTREILSPPETAISTPDLESPDEALLDGFKLTPTSRRPSPLST